ncbi:MAG: lipocalin family protein [bacterium]
MKTTLSILAVTALLLAASLVATTAPARAGSAGTGKVSSGTFDPSLSADAKLLIGQWRMAAFVTNGRRVPLPGNYHYDVTLRADGTLTFRMGVTTPKANKGTWKLKGRQLTLVYNKKPMQTQVQITRRELVVSMPGRANMRMVFQRLTNTKNP